MRSWARAESPMRRTAIFERALAGVVERAELADIA
jgi:hypothetical protein